MSGRQFMQGLDPDPTVQALVRWLHAAMEQVPAPNILYYEEPALAYHAPMHRRVTPTVLYEPGPMRDWMLELAAELLARGGEHDVDGHSGPRRPAGRRAWNGTRRATAARRKPG